MEPLFSMFLIGAFLVLPSLVVLRSSLSDFLLHWRIARRTKAPSWKGGEHHGKVTLHGVIVESEAKPHVMRIEFDLERGRWETLDTFYESGRRVQFERFWVRTSAGTTVEVQPSDKTILLEKLEVAEGKDSGHCIGSATLRVGQTIHVVGELVKEPDASGDFVGHRELPAAKRVLYASHLSTTPIQPRYRARTRWHAWILLLTTVAAVLFHFIAASDYYRRALYGEKVSAEVVEKHLIHTPHDDHFHRPNYEVTIATAYSRYTIETNEPEYSRIKIGNRIPVIVVPGHPESSQVGDLSSVPPLLVALAGLLLIAVRLVSLLWNQDTQPWYWQRKVHLPSRLAPVSDGIHRQGNRILKKSTADDRGIEMR